MKLYQFVFGNQPHYVVAVDYGDAERTIEKEYSSPTKIECLGPYVMVSDKAKEEESND